MKTVLTRILASMTLIPVLVSTQALAATHYPSVELETNAEQNAMQNCYKAGLSDCVILNDATITECEQFDCEATATARGISN